MKKILLIILPVFILSCSEESSSVSYNMRTELNNAMKDTGNTASYCYYTAGNKCENYDYIETTNHRKLYDSIHLVEVTGDTYSIEVTQDDVSSIILDITHIEYKY